MVIIYCKLPLHKADFFKMYPNALAKGKHPRRCVLFKTVAVQKNVSASFPVGFFT